MSSDPHTDFARYALPIAEIDDGHVRGLLPRARLIWGWSPKTNAARLFHGRLFLEDLQKGRESEFETHMAYITPDTLYHPDLATLEAPLVLVFSLDWETDEPVRLATAVMEACGDCDWQP